ncbi:hypothetical protein SAMN05216436_11750 [bacterium A37T11]|nr:hypothetical protein SAMN05216436_11750 [bacterium A37T11]
MKRFLPSHFEELKKQVIEKAGISNLKTSDCYRLAVDIYVKTQKQISETTLKRIFGFAERRYNPSSFTLNAMAEFCGYESWTAYNSHVENFQVRNKPTRTWQSVRQAAHKITHYTLETNKQKSGIPYKHTISRASLERHIDLFEHTKANVCLVSGQAGSGKTIGLTHWVEQQLSKSLHKKDQNIYIFVNSNSLLQVAGYGYDGNRWLAQVLAMQINTIKAFLTSYKRQAPGNFYLIIDDLNNHIFNEKHFNLIINQLIDMSAYFSAFSWFKFIISTRPDTWQLYKHLIEGSKTLYANWYTSFNSHKGNESANMIPFSIDEIQQLANKLTGNHLQTSERFKKQYSLIKLPIYFQYYYKLKGKNIDPKMLNTADQYAIASPYIEKHVLKGIRNTEKQILTNLLFNHANFNNNEISINKEKVYHFIKQYNIAYRELLQSGIFLEFHTESKYSNHTEIRVYSILLATYFIAKNLLSGNNYAINTRIIELISQQAYPENIRISIMRWVIVFSMESCDLTFINDLIQRSFGTPYENHFNIFCCNTICNIGAKNIENRNKLNNQLNNTPFIEYVLLIPGLQTSYIHTIKQLLQFSLTDKNKIYIHSKLGLMAILLLDDVEASQHITTLKEYQNAALSVFAINPLHGLETLHHYFSFNTINIDAICELTHYYFKPEIHQPSKQHELILTIAFCCGILTNNPKKIIRLINAIQFSLHKNPSTIASQDFKITLQLFKDIELIRSGKSKNVAGYLSTITRTKTHKFNQVLEKIIRVLLDEHSYSDSVFHITHLLEIVIHEKITLLEVYIRKFLIHSANNFSENSIKEHQLALKQIQKKTNYQLQSMSAWRFPYQIGSHNG